MCQIECGYWLLLDWLLGYGCVMGIGVGVVLLFGVGVYLGIGKIFMLMMDEGDMLVQLVKQLLISLEVLCDQDLVIECVIRIKLFEVEYVIVWLGLDELGLDLMGFNEIDMFLQFKFKLQWCELSNVWLEE